MRSSILKHEGAVSICAKNIDVNGFYGLLTIYIKPKPYIVVQAVEGACSSMKHLSHRLYTIYPQWLRRCERFPENDTDLIRR